MNLIIATHNRDKLVEIRASFEVAHLHVLGADDVHLPEVEEDGETLEANAIKKAMSAARATGCWALSDDTGLEVDALDGAPGVYAARYSGEGATYASNVAKLLKELDGVEDRTAKFRTVVALCSPSGDARVVDGSCRGRIARAASGDQGFGYDPVFIPDGENRSFAEMTLEEKKAISHRGRAVRAAHDAWADFLAAHPADWS